MFNKNLNEIDSNMKKLLAVIIVVTLIMGGCRRHPVADFSMTPSTVYVNEKVHFLNLSVNASSFYWEIDGIGDYSWTPEPVTFSTPGDKKVSLTAYSSRAENTMTKYLHVIDAASGGGSSSGSQPIDDYKDFKYINTHKYPYRVTQTRDGVLIGTYSVPANSTKIIKCKCNTTEVHKVEQTSGYFEHPNNTDIEPFTVDCSNVSSGGYYYYTIKCNTSKIKYVNGNSVPYTVDITCASNNTNYSATIQGNSSDTFTVEAGCEYTVKFTQQSGYSFWPSTSTYTVQVDCGYTYTRNAPTNVKGEAERLNNDEFMYNDEAAVNDAIESEEDVYLCNE